jgi:twitching motility protein PilT
MIDYINENRKVHIVTLEDPIEYVFKNKRALVTQRQIV